MLFPLHFLPNHQRFKLELAAYRVDSKLGNLRSNLAIQQKGTMRLCAKISSDAVN